MPVYGGFAPTHGQTLGTVTLGTLEGFPMDILKLDWSQIKREAIEVTNMNVQPTTSSTDWGNRMFVPSAYVDPGELVLQIHHNPQVTLAGYITDPFDDGPQGIVITLGPSASNQEQFNVLGFITEYSIDGPLDGKTVTATVKIKLTDYTGSTYLETGAVGWTTAS